MSGIELILKVLNGTSSDNMKTVHQCQQCESTFSSKSNLNTHIISMHKSVKYPCTKCNTKFSSKYYLKSHIMSVHEGDIIVLNVTQNF